MMRVLSDVFPPEIKPVRDGWYLTRIVGGEYWLLVAFRAGDWRNDISLPMNGRPREWRGLAFDPAAAVQPKTPVRGGRFDGVYGVFVPGATCDD